MHGSGPYPAVVAGQAAPSHPRLSANATGPHAALDTAHSENAALRGTGPSSPGFAVPQGWSSPGPMSSAEPPVVSKAHPSYDSEALAETLMGASLPVVAPPAQAQGSGTLMASPSMPMQAQGSGTLMASPSMPMSSASMPMSAPGAGMPMSSASMPMSAPGAGMPMSSASMPMSSASMPMGSTPSGPWSAPGSGSRSSAGYRIENEMSVDIPPPDEVDPPSERPPSAKDPYIGTTFDHRYKIEDILGEGGMGVVYRARHKVIDKKVAVKVLRADLARDREILDRFVQEARAASSIGNAHIVDISDFGDLPDGSTYFVMEYLEGKSLTALVERDRRISVERIASIAMQITDGLSAAHAAGIVHRDLKPDNVFVVPRGAEKEFIKILDFGIAKVSNSGTTKLTRAGAVFGTPHYMSPEQAAGAPIDHRTDIYSLGVMLYEMTSGQLPFNADNFMGILTQHMYKAPVPIRALVPAPDCPPGLEAVILKCLSKKPDGRYQSMDELGTDLALLLRGEVPVAVNEMMARSGGFNVPHDFFKPIHQQAIVPATPAGQRRLWPRYVWIAGGLAAVALVTLIVVKGSDTGASPQTPQEAATGVQAPVPGPEKSASPVAAKTRTVAIAASPDSALAYRDGKLVTLPATITIEEGKIVTVEFKADGYETARVELDGSQPSQVVKLVKAAAGASPIRHTTPTTPTAKSSTAAAKPPTTSTGGKSSEIVDPWK